MLDNTNWRAGRAGGPCFQMKNVNIGGLLIRQRSGPVRRDAQKGGPAGFSAARRPRLCVQLTGPLCCAAFSRPGRLCSLPKIHVIHLETRPSCPPALRLVLSVNFFQNK